MYSKFLAGVIAIIALVCLIGIGKIVENVAADEICVIQYPTGRLKFVTTPGPTIQAFGKVTSYPRRGIYKFEAPVQFNDGGKGVIHGSIQYDLPLDITNLKEIYTRFSSAEAIQQQVMEVVTNKVIYMTGPVMSSRESYAEKRNYLINYVQDQIDHGIYQTRRVTREEVDQFTGQKRLLNVAEIIIGEDGKPARQESSVVGEFGLRAFNFAIEQIDYDDVVEKQIADQQRITMEVQTSIADALKAQQAAITTEQQGRAEAAAAKWAQEVIKAKEVTAAQQRLEVAQLATKEAEQYKTAALLKAEGDAGYRRKMMEADNALQQRLDAAVKINQFYADAIKNFQGNLVPGVVMGGSSNSGSVNDLISLLVAQTAAQTGLKKDQ
jgi:hypothetical protein